MITSNFQYIINVIAFQCNRTLDVSSSSLLPKFSLWPLWPPACHTLHITRHCYRSSHSDHQPVTESESWSQVDQRMASTWAALAQPGQTRGNANWAEDWPPWLSGERCKNIRLILNPNPAGSNIEHPAWIELNITMYWSEECSELLTKSQNPLNLYH